jgi:phytoene dehydrogenase-like protein
VIQKNKYDVIIIGAGISGLICGCYLAKAGMKVLICEQHNKPGGYFTSFKRGKFLFDAAAHSFGNYREGGHVQKILTELGVNKLIKIIRFDPSDIIITSDFKIAFWNDTQKTIADLITIFPKEKDNIIDFFNFLTSANQSEFARLKDKTFGYLLRFFFRDEKLINSLAFPVLGNGGLPPSQMHAFSGAKIFSEFIIDGGYYPEGGIHSLPQALEHIIKQNNGEILYRKLVKKILCENNIVVGVKLNNGELYYSKYVVSACDMTQTFKTLLGEKIAGEQLINTLESMIPSLSTFILYVGINKSFKGLLEPGTNIWYLPYYDSEEIYNQTQKCNFNKTGYMLRVSPNKKTIVAFVAAPFKTTLFWRNNKKKKAKDLLNRIEKLVPDLKKHVVYFDAATPHTLYRYTLNYKGAPFGWAKTTLQTFDPIFSKTTFINGLYLTGHWTSIAFGLPGTCYSGHDTAMRILRKEKSIFLRSADKITKI